MNETTKAAPRRAKMEIFQRAFSGHGIDIGCGNDPLTVGGWRFPAMTSVEGFDRQHGDAARIDELRPHDHYDFVYSSQTLEDMEHPMETIRRWGLLLKPGGYLVFSVPDFELYEESVWPSQRNGAHKTCWGIGINHEAPGHCYYAMANVIHELTTSDRYGKWRFLLVQLVDTNYDYSKRGQGIDQTLGDAEAFIEVVMQKTR